MPLVFHSNTYTRREGGCEKYELFIEQVIFCHRRPPYTHTYTHSTFLHWVRVVHTHREGKDKIYKDDINTYKDDDNNDGIYKEKKNRRWVCLCVYLTHPITIRYEMWIVPSQKYAKQLFRNWGLDTNDPLITNFFFRKSLRVNLEDPPLYNYWLLTWLSCGCLTAVVTRYFIGGPDTMFRHTEKARNPLDRWKLHLYSLPYFNHRLRNYAVTWGNTWIDNEPDYQLHHPWGLRPQRSVQHRRFWLAFSNPHRYCVDNPMYENCMHKNVEKRYEDLGYYPDRKKLAVDEANEDDE